MVRWDNVDVMELIARQITSPEDVFSFSGVSRVWRSAAARRKIGFRSSLVPWLMLPAKKGTDLRSFFSLSEGLSRDCRQIIIPEANGNKCYSSKGWLMVINTDWSLFLLHPLSRLRIQLPHIKTFRNWEDLSMENMEFAFIGKFLLSASPSLVSKYTCMVIHGNTSKIAFFRPGFKSWITIDSCQSSYCDFIFYEDLFYLTDVKGTLISIDIKSDNTAVGKHVAKWPTNRGSFSLNDPKFYLVESAGKLLGVERLIQSTDYFELEYPYLTLAFTIYELDWSSNTWTEVDDLGNRALFLGDNSSLSVEVSDVSICKPNSIYFTDDRQKSYHSVNEGGKDMGIYNLQEMIIEPFFKGSNIYDQITPPMWVEQADDMGQSVLDSVRAKIDEELKKLDEKIADAEENLGESEVREAHLAKSLFYIQIGHKDKALEQLKVTEGKTVAVGQKMDLVFYTLQLGFLYMDFDLISKSIEKAKSLFEEGADWERKNCLKVYEGLYCMSTRNFKMAADLFLDSISTFTTYELFPYDTFIFYTVLTSFISLDRVSLKQKVVDAPEILTVIGKIPYLSEFLNSLYYCQYKSFFSAFAGLTEKIKLDRYLHPHFRYYMREVRTVMYSQFLEPYKSVTIEAMAKAFGVSVEFIDLELSRFIAAGKLHCKIDKVAGVLETNRPDAKNAPYQATIKQGDMLLNQIQKLSHVTDL